MFEEDFISFLGANAGLTALLTDPDYSRRIFPAPLPESIAMPAVTYTLVAQVRPRVFGGGAGLVKTRWQLDAWGTQYADAAELAEAVRLALDGFAGTMTSAGGSTAVQLAQLISQTDFFEDARMIYRRMLEFYIWIEQ